MGLSISDLHMRVSAGPAVVTYVTKHVMCVFDTQTHRLSTTPHRIIDHPHDDLMRLLQVCKPPIKDVPNSLLPQIFANLGGGGGGGGADAALPMPPAPSP